MVRNVKANVTNIMPWLAKNARKNKMQLYGIDLFQMRGEWYGKVFLVGRTNFGSHLAVC